MSFELMCLVVFVLGVSIYTFVPERVILVIGSVAGIIWSIIQFVRLA